MSHHSSEEPTPEQKSIIEEMFKQVKRESGDVLRNAMRDMAGEFPHGRLNAQDEGAVPLAISNENGKVKLMFPKPVAWIGFTPEQAVEIAETLIKHARQCSTRPLTVKI